MDPAIASHALASHAPAAHVIAGSAIRQSLVPMLAGYLVVMVPLGLALIRLRRAGPAALDRPAPPAGEPSAAQARRGWLALLRHAGVTAISGYLLLVGVDVAYYYGVARVGGDFLSSAVSGPAVLMGLAVPLFAAASWLYERRRGRPSGGGGDRGAAVRDGDSADR